MLPLGQVGPLPGTAPELERLPHPEVKLILFFLLLLSLLSLNVLVDLGLLYNI